MSDEQKRSAKELSTRVSHTQRSDAPPALPLQGEAFIEQISAHIEAHLGPVYRVLHELESDVVHIDIHIVKPTADFPFVRLVTSGMSDLPMTTPEGDDDPRYAELLITLPPDWRLDRESWSDEAWFWPVRLLKRLARLPHLGQTWLGWGHSISNEEPYAPGCGFTGALILPSITVPDPFQTLDIEGVKTVVFYAVIPLYEAEMNLKVRSGTAKLLEKFERWDVTDIVDPSRRNVAKKRLGFW